jgi:predicted Kef-type K+ transport protein
MIGEESKEHRGSSNLFLIKNIFTCVFYICISFLQHPTIASNNFILTIDDTIIQVDVSDKKNR